MIELIEFIKENILTISSIVAGVGAWGYERNKRKLEIKQSESDIKKSESDIRNSETSNNKDIMDMYQDALNDLKKRYDEKFLELEAEIKILREKLEAEHVKYNSLKKSFETYRRNNKNE